MTPLVVGTVKEIKDNENRVGLTPYCVEQLKKANIRVVIETNAGIGSGFTDEEYQKAGAEILNTPQEVIKQIDVLVKVKEPLEHEYHLLELMQGKVLYTYLHLSGVPRSLTEALLKYKITGIAYETIEENGKLPCLAPMSKVAGVLAVQYGAEYLQKKYNGRGLTLSPIGDADTPHTVIIGGGIVGGKAAKVAGGMGGKVTVFDLNPDRIVTLKKEIDEYLGPHLSQNVQVIRQQPEIFEAEVKDADLLIGAVLRAGAKAPMVVSEELVKEMKTGAVIVDVSIDQGGCIWGSKTTTHSKPIYELYGKIYCCVANMPGQAARQSTQALTTATLPYLIEICEKGVFEAIKDNLGLAKGLNTLCGRITFKAVAEDLNLMDKYFDLEAVRQASIEALQSCSVVA